MLESVVACDLERAAYRQLRQRLNRLINDEEGDRLRIYRLCASWRAQIEISGDGPPPETSQDISII